MVFVLIKTKWDVPPVWWRAPMFAMCLEKRTKQEKDVLFFTSFFSDVRQAPVNVSKRNVSVRRATSEFLLSFPHPWEERSEKPRGIRDMWDGTDTTETTNHNSYSIGVVSRASWLLVKSPCRNERITHVRYIRKRNLSQCAPVLVEAQRTKLVVLWNPWTGTVARQRKLYARSGF